MNEQGSHDGGYEAQVLRRVAWRVNLGVFLGRAAGAVAAVLIAFGVAFLLCRMLAPAYAKYTFGLLAGVPAAMVWAWTYCRRKGLLFNEREVVELADHLSASDGLAAVAYERPGLAAAASVANSRTAVASPTAGVWQGIAGRLQLRALRLDPVWFAWRLAPAALFAGAVLFVPPRVPVEPPSTMMTAITQPLAEKVKMAAEVLPEPEREKLEKQIEQVQKAPEGVSKEKWEAVEDLEQRLENAMAQSAASTFQLSSSMNQLAAMVSKQEMQAPNVNSAELQADINTMAASIQNQLAKGQTPLSQDMLKRMQEALSKCKNGQCKSGDLAKLLKDCQGMCDKLGKKDGALSKYAGRGGRDRGRADAELLFGEERKLDGAKFDEKQLENQFFESADLTDIGITTLEPKPEPGKFSPGMVKDFGAQQGTNVSRTEISPSQRGAVERYFK